MEAVREVGGWGRDPNKCTGRDWGMGSSTIQWNLRPVVKYYLRRGIGFMKFLENGSRPQPPTSRSDIATICCRTSLEITQVTNLVAFHTNTHHFHMYTIIWYTCEHHVNTSWKKKKVMAEVTSPLFVAELHLKLLKSRTSLLSSHRSAPMWHGSFICDTSPHVWGGYD